MKGIVLAGGLGTRLYPLTQGISKQLMPVYDKPMIYYPLSVLMGMGLQDILIISTPRDLPAYQSLLKDGTQLGCHFEYAVQKKPTGLADAFCIGKNFIGQGNVALILGDNIFYGAGLEQALRHCTKPNGGIVFAYHMEKPQQYGVINFDDNGKAIHIEEKPRNPQSHYAIPGIYFYDNSVIKLAQSLKPSPRGEKEITDLNMLYLKQHKLQVTRLERGIAWLDTGTFTSLLQASQFVQAIEERQGLKIGCIEEIAYQRGYIDGDQLYALAKPLMKSGYGAYLKGLIV